MAENSEDGNSACSHYTRRCLLVAPCCAKSYRCRICHDEVESHKLDRSKVEAIICAQCDERQEVGRNCVNCGILFGNYTCLICRLFDDRDRGQFHCDGCGLCRVGGSDNFFHCGKCGMCISISLKDSHKCLEDISKRNCPVCLDDIHTSRDAVHIPSCAHLLHQRCLKGMLQHGSTSCPVCNKSLIDMSDYWKELDAEIANTLMPGPYRDYKVNVLCRDCHEKTKTPFHVLGLKCQACGSYNTTRIGGDDPLPIEVAETSTDTEEVVLENIDIEEASDLENSWETLSNEEIENDEISLDNIVEGENNFEVTNTNQDSNNTENINQDSNNTENIDQENMNQDSNNIENMNQDSNNTENMNQNSNNTENSNQLNRSLSREDNETTNRVIENLENISIPDPTENR